MMKKYNFMWNGTISKNELKKESLQLSLRPYNAAVKSCPEHAMPYTISPEAIQTREKNKIKAVAWI